MAADDARTPEQQLVRERTGAPLAIGTAAAAAILPMAGSIVAGLAFRHVISEDTSRLLAFHKHQNELLVGTILVSIGTLLTAPLLRYLYDATKYRRSELGPAALVCALVGPVLAAAGQFAAQLVLDHDSAHFATHGSQTYPEAHKVLTSTALGVANGVRLVGALMLGFALIVIALNAMRVGLLTRFLGVLGIVTGVLFVIPLGSPLPIIQSFWLAAIAVLIAGRWPNGVPPSWRSGKAEPWPSQQELREQREQARKAG